MSLKLVEMYILPQSPGWNIIYQVEKKSPFTMAGEGFKIAIFHLTLPGSGFFCPLEQVPGATQKLVSTAARG